MELNPRFSRTIESSSARAAMVGAANIRYDCSSLMGQPKAKMARSSQSRSAPGGGADPRVKPPLSPERLAAIAIEERKAVQKPGELAGLLRLLAADPPRRVVEIGTAWGGTLWAFCQVATPDAVLVSIDLPSGGPYGNVPWADDALRFKYFQRPEQRIVVLPLDSQDAATAGMAAEALGGQPADLVFIDGDHRYESVKRDFELYSPLATPGGVMALHDIAPYPALDVCDVERLWRELEPRYRSQAIVSEEFFWHGTDWGGIGVLWMEG